MVPSGDSREVHSSQAGIHPRLDEVVRRHLHSTWRQPVHAHTQAMFDALCGLLDADEVTRLVLDSGCGTGASSAWLAARHPDHVVVGVDRSAHRLARAAGGPVRQGNVLWVRAELASFWRVAVRAGWRLHAHYLLYPNPWPKPAQLQRRWHAHPVFPELLALGGSLTLRTNWAIYAREFARALELAGWSDFRLQRLDAAQAASPYELKYARSGHALWEVSQPGFHRRTSGSRPA